MVQVRGEWTPEDTGCSAVKRAYRSKGFDTHEVEERKPASDDVSLCPGDQNCCTPQMEHNLIIQSKQEFEETVGQKIRNLQKQIASQATKSNALFTSLLDNSKTSFHNIFLQTYGLLYKENSALFMSLFDSLSSYYRGSDINLPEALDGFFIQLFHRLFQYINSQYEFDEQFLSCLTEHMDELKPFGDQPNKLSRLVRCAFIAARTLVQGLTVGKNVITEVSMLQQSVSCTGDLMKLSYCPYCAGKPYLKPCYSYCMDIMKGCLAPHAILNKPWNNYIDALITVAERLDGPFNFQSVVEPLDVRISDGIMNFQFNAEIVLTKSFELCGAAPLGKKYKRSATYRPDTTSAKTQGNDVNYNKLVREIKSNLKNVEDIWKQLPRKLCNNLVTSTVEESNCWNGHLVHHYGLNDVEDGIAFQGENSEVEVNTNNKLLEQLILELNIMTTKLKDACNGLDVESVDTESDDSTDAESEDWSGSGYDAYNY